MELVKLGYSAHKPVRSLATGHKVGYHSVLHSKTRSTCACHYINPGSESCQRSVAEHKTEKWRGTLE